MNSASVSSSMSTVTVNQKKSAMFSKFLDRAANFKPFEANTYDHHSVSFFGLLDNNSEHKKIVDLCKTEFGCNCCKNRVHYIARVVDSDGATFCSAASTMPFEQTSEQLMMGALTHERVCAEEKVVGAPKWTLALVPRPKHVAFRKMEGGFDHYHITITRGANYLTTEYDDSFYNTALNNYVPMVHAMLTKFTSADWLAIRGGLPKLKEILEVETYGKCALGSVKWFNEILDAMLQHVDFVNHPLQMKMNIIGKSIIGWVKRSTDLTAAELDNMDDEVEHLHSTPVLTVYHQFNNNILNLLQSSNTEKEMRCNVETRFNPNVYQRRTAPPKQGALDTSMKILGSYSFTISTTAEIEAREDCATVNGAADMDDAMSHMKALKTKSKYSFVEETMALHPKTVDELVAFIRSGEVKTLDIDTSEHTTCYIAETTLARANCVAPYGWCYLNGQASRFNGIHKVTHIMTIRYAGSENFVFVLENSKTCREITTTVGWSEFLSTGIRRVAGPTFEAVAKTMPIKYPRCGYAGRAELAIGIGTSKKNTHGKLFSNIRVKINGGRWIIIDRSN